MRIEPPDLMLWLTAYIRAEGVVAGLDFEVGTREPAELQLPLPRPLIVIRDDGGSRKDWITFDRTIGASVLAGTRANERPANDLARWLASVLFDDALPLVQDCPIASVDWDGCNGPFDAAETLDVARRYLTAKYVVSGSW